MTLWESAPRQKCVNCQKEYRVWDPFEAHKKGESTCTLDYPDWEPYIDSGYTSNEPHQIYKGWCSKCKTEDLHLRFQLMISERNEQKV